MVPWNLDIHIQKNEVWPYLTSYIKINTKWIKDLNLSPNTIKVLEEETRQKLQDIARGNDFFNMTPNALATKEKTDKLNLKKILFL